jgi:peptidoglycan/LPS O-acetylase OafA/YrhL
VHPRPSHQNLVAIQILRGIAAIGVVVSHFQIDFPHMTGLPAPGPPLQLGNSGVDLFFVISGFVMVYASESLFGDKRGPAIFFAHRAIRIVPLYWLVTSLYVLMALAVPAFDKSYSIEAIARSYSFIPYMRPEGDIQPIVGQGWTLNYEMFFYVIFAAAVFFARDVAVVIVSCLLVLVALAGKLLAPLPIALAFWTDPIVLEFVFGMLLALSFRYGVRLPGTARVILVVAAPVLVPILFWLLSSGTAWRALTIGLPAALLMAGATLGDFAPSGTVWRALGTIGGASYALYLFHSFPIRAILLGARALGLDPVAAYWPLMMLAVICAVIFAIAIYYGFERPVTRVLRNLASRRHALAVAEPKLARAVVHDADHDRHPGL